MLEEHRQKIEQIKKQFEVQFKDDLTAYKRAIIRQIFYLKNKYNADDMEELATVLLQHLKYPPAEKEKLLADMRRTQKQIGQEWDDYFDAQTQPSESQQAGVYEKLLAAHSVDFDSINKKHKKIMLEEVRRAARADYGYDTLRRRIIQRGVPDAETLANTAVAQFDNAYMFENAEQAGVKQFKYDGALHANSRPFCKAHLGRIYTEAQIEQLNNGQGLSVRSSCGGYNCTHFWTPVIEEDKGQMKNEKKQNGELEAANKNFFQTFYDKSKQYKFDYETTLKAVVTGEKALPENMELAGRMNSADFQNWLRDVKSSEYLTFSAKDIDQDFLRHAPKFKTGITRDEYINIARDIVKNSRHYLAQYYLPINGEGEDQLLFFGKNGYAVVNKNNEIKGCYYHKDIQKAFYNLKRSRIWLKNKGASWLR